MPIAGRYIRKSIATWNRFISEKKSYHNGLYYFLLDSYSISPDIHFKHFEKGTCAIIYAEKTSTFARNNIALDFCSSCCDFSAAVFKIQRRAAYFGLPSEDDYQARTL